MKKHRSPGAALLWSLTIPGFGQLYNRDYLVGLILIVLEFLINVKANLNLVIFFSCRGQYLESIKAADLQWLLFYPCVYCFSLWHAYNRAIEINHELEKSNEDHYRISYTGLFIGSAMGGTLGVIYSFTIGPVWGGIAGMAVGGLLGLILERSIGR